MKNDIVLATLNARYIHTAFGLRYLKANLHDLEPRSRICEFTLHQRPLDIAEQILSYQPKIIGLGVYIWNAEQSLQLVRLLKKLAPEVILVLGGPEVSYEQELQPVCQLADHVLVGPSELSFFSLCSEILGKPVDHNPATGKQALESIRLPYYLYNDEDIAHRVIYVEASRGCPFKCEFCLSALDKTAWPFPLEPFLDQMEQLFQRGARHFKFVDRTFNLNIQASLAILQFFLDKMTGPPESNQIFVHFEVIPDRLPEALKESIMRFPPGSLQFEVGVQTFNPKVQAIIQRKQDDVQTRENLAWLSAQNSAHIHADLIFGLPGESMQSMADSFDQLVTLGPEEIQLGILKRLRGMPMVDQEKKYELVFNPNPPYELLSTRDVSFADMQRLRRMARYWDLVANSGRFETTLPGILGNRPFARFMRLSDWLFRCTGQTHKINLMRLFDLLFEALTTEFRLSADEVTPALEKDYQRSGLKGLPQCLRTTAKPAVTATMKKGSNRRQRVHSDAA